MCLPQLARAYIYLYLNDKTEMEQVNKNMEGATLGLRNHNPLNIRHNAANRWVGTDKDVPQRGGFVKFIAPEYGLRAAVIIMKRYIALHHADTPRKIAVRWAPPSENDTEAYVSFVCRRSGLAPDAVVAAYGERLALLVSAMALIESGYKVSPAEVQAVREKYNV